MYNLVMNLPRQIFVLGIILLAPCLISADIVETELGVVHYSQAPKTWNISIPENFQKVEIAVYQKANGIPSQYNGWQAYLKINGRDVWKFMRFDEKLGGIIYDNIINQEVRESAGRNKYLDVTSMIISGQNTITYYHYNEGEGLGVKVRIYTENSKAGEITTKISQKAIHPEGGKSFFLEVESTGKSSVDRENVRKIMRIIQKRLEFRGIADVQIKQIGDRKLVVYTKGIEDMDEVTKLVVNSFRLEFKVVDDEHSLEKAIEGKIPLGDEILYEYRVEGGEVIKIPYLIGKKALLTGDLIEKADVLIDKQFNQLLISIRFNETGKMLFAEITRKAVMKRLAIVLDGNVISAPVIREEIKNGEARISGSFTQEDARDIAIALNSGPLPIGVKALKKEYAESAEDKLSPFPADTSRPLVVKSDVDDFPSSKSKPNKNAYAIVIGIENYRQKLPKADFADADAKLVTEYLTKVMGYPEENVVTLINDRAALGDMAKYFEKWLPNNVEKDGSVFIYYSGHGAPNPKTGDAYLVPYDGDPSFIDETGYSLKRLYDALGKLPAKEVIVALDSCFSGSGGRSVVAKGARPLVMSMESLSIPQKITVLSAASGEQISSTYEEQGHGLFTYFMLKGLRGEGDVNGDGKIEIGELFNYIKPNVEKIARKVYNNEQSPQITGRSDKQKLFLKE